jgi:15-cis-phytoene synthase
MPQSLFERSLASVSDYEECRAAIREGSRSFYAASRLLPPAVRRPAFGLYAFCRLSDDAVDLEGGSRAALARLSDRLVRAGEGRPLPFASDRAMADLLHRHAIPIAVPLALLEGLAWDAEGRTYETLDDLYEYAVRVAGTVGVMMALLMGVRSPQALARASELGIAMQLTNIARDVGEDARLGRLYRPRQWLRETGGDGAAWIANPTRCDEIRAVVTRLLEAAGTLYSRALAGVALLPVRCRPAILAAALIYAEIGREVERNGHDPVTRRARVSGARKLQLIARAVVGLPRLTNEAPAPPLECARFLIEAAADGNLALRCAPRALADWRTSFLGVLGTFERLERAERFGD